MLLDTNALLWLLAGDQRLGRDARAAVHAADELGVSVASLWEITIKVSLGKLAAPPDLYRQLRDLGFRRLPIEDAHLDVLRSLPWHHRDLFDRLLVSQAIAERRAVLTADRSFSAYGVEVVDARG